MSYRSTFVLVVVLLVSAFSFLSPPAYAAPQVSNVKVSIEAAHKEKFDAAPPTASWGGSAYVTWTTSEPATSKVIYGLNGNTNLSTYEQKALTTQHVVRVQRQLEENKEYTYKIVSRNAAGQETIYTPVAPDDLKIKTLTSAESKWWEVGHDLWYKNRDFQTGSKWISNFKAYRKKVTISNPADVDGAWIQITRHHQGGPGLQLFVNGQKVGSWPYGFSLQTYDIKSKLVTGENVIALFQETQNYDLLTQGEIVFISGAPSISLHTDQTSWKAHANPPSGWMNPGASDSGWSTPNLNPNWNDPSPMDGPYGQNIVSALPGPTTAKNREVLFTKTVSRLNKLLESTLLEPVEDRSSLSLPENTETVIHTAISAAMTKAASVVPSLDSAKQNLIDGNVASFNSNIGTAGGDLTDAELKGEVAFLLARTHSEHLQLTKASELVPAGVSGQLSSALTSINQAITNIGQSNYSGAKTSLNSATSSLATARTSLENAWGYKIPVLNDSIANPLGWLRLRQSELFGMDVRYQNNLKQLKMKNDVNFAVLPGTQEKRLEDAVSFLSPFAVINASGTSYGLGSAATHVAFELNGQVVVKSTSGSIYSSSDGQLTKNWLFVWNTGAKNNAYLIVLQKKPASISYAGSDIIISQSSGVGNLVVFTPYSDGASITSTTADFGTTAAANVITDMQKFSQIMTQVPLNYTELYRDDAANNRGDVFIKYSYFDLNDEWNTPPITIAPWPTLLSFAKKYNYPGITLPDASTDSKLLISETNFDWDTYQFVENTDTLHYYTPLMRDGNYMRGVNGDGKDWEIQIADDLGFNTMRLNVGDLVLDYATCGETNCGPNNTFLLKSGWQTALTTQVDAINSKGMKAVILVWNAIRAANSFTPSKLEANTDNAQANFINGWQQVADLLKNKNVAYDLVNEPEFLQVSIYNTVMGSAATAIRSVDTNNPIMIEGWRNYAKDFGGMTHPGTTKTYFEHHPYPNGYYQLYSTIEQYYPGLSQDWWNNVYTDRDAYFEEFWKGNVRKIFQDNITFYNGEFGVQVTPTGSKAKHLYDMATLNFRYGIHQTYFKGTGWTMFDIYAGQGTETLNDIESINALLTNYQTVSQPPPIATPSPAASPSPLPGDVNGDGEVDIADINQVISDFGKDVPPLPSDANGDGIVNIFDYSIVVSDFGS